MANNSANSNQVGLLGAARLKDRCILGCFFPRIPAKSQTAFTHLFEEGIERVRPVGSARAKTEADETILFMQVDPSAAFVYGAVVTDKSYPDRIAYQMLTEFQNIIRRSDAAKLETAAARSLERPLKSLARDIIIKYGNASLRDPTAQVLMKVESVKVIVDNNIKKVLETHGNLEDLATRTDNLAGAANQFNKDATAVKNITWRQKVGLTVVLGVLVAGIVAYMIYVLVELFA